VGLVEVSSTDCWTWSAVSYSSSGITATIKDSVWLQIGLRLRLRLRNGLVNLPVFF